LLLCVWDGSVGGAGFAISSAAGFDIRFRPWLTVCRPILAILR